MITDHIKSLNYSFHFDGHHIDAFENLGFMQLYKKSINKRNDASPCEIFQVVSSNVSKLHNDYIIFLSYCLIKKRTKYIPTENKYLSKIWSNLP